MCVVCTVFTVLWDNTFKSWIESLDKGIHVDFDIQYIIQPEKDNILTFLTSNMDQLICV